MYVAKLTVRDFITRSTGLYQEMSDAFRLVTGQAPGESEVNSWRNSLPKLAEVLALTSEGVHDADIYLEYWMPSSSTRADVLIAGLNGRRQRVGVVVELKQWDARSILIEGHVLKVGPAWHAHPSDQALGYRDYLADLSPAYSDQNVVLKSGSFLHNVPRQSLASLSSGPFQKLVDLSPIFAGDMQQEMADWISASIQGPPDSRFAEELDSDEVRVSRTLFSTVAKAVHDEPTWRLLDTQRVAFERILDLVTLRTDEKHLVLVTGGPGTGKSVVAMQLFGELNRRQIPTVHVTNSSSFTTVMRSLLAVPRSRQWSSKATEGLLRLSHSWVRRKDRFEVAIADEAHRFRTRTGFKHLRSPRPQAEEVMENVRVFVAFTDEKQILRKDEAGTVDYFRSAALAVGVKPENIHGPIELEAQFRSAGSQGFVDALDSALYLGEPTGFTHPRFQARVFDTVEELEGHLIEHVDAGDSARLVAGFCWPWSDPLPDGSLVADVQVGKWRRPWNRKAIQGRSYTSDTHPYTLWARNATDPLGEVGCIYSAQGFEFDHVGVIWGPDLVWRTDRWVAQPHCSHDGEMRRGRRVTAEPIALPLLRNAYRVLASRGMKSCSIYCIDDETRDYLRAALASGT